jgi:RNA polymerase sigma-70 factor (ECF subfamily)
VTYHDNNTKAADSMFTAAWSEMLPELRHRALRLSNGHHDRADDMLADTAVKALIFMRKSPGSITDPRGFLFIVLRHVFLDSIRRCRNEVAVLDARLDAQACIDAAIDQGPSAQRVVDMHDSLKAVGDAVAAMSSDQRRLFAFRFVDELPYPAIAERLGIQQPLARKRVELLRRNLRATFGRRLA